ncbi:MAG TPA: hypothetical protein VL201_04865 [Patescibacteria group bacterium]|jgi:hypothetical protein|nr:hypothetical protein [Patescibacteria group bacterium]
MKQMKCISLLFCGILFSTEILGIGHINKIRPLYDRQKSDIIKKLIKKLNDPKKIPREIPIPKVQKNFKRIKNDFVDDLQLNPFIEKS